jgi:predicted Zn finger-like uncharacterized protein
MDLRCERCRAQYVVNDDRVPEVGVAVACARCGHVFRVKRKALVVTVPLRAGEVVEAIPVTALSEPRPAGEGPLPGERREAGWMLRQGASVFALKELTTLQRWIVERRVTRDDHISANGDQWRRLGDIPELGPFFEVVDVADRAPAQAAPRPSTAPAPAATAAEESRTTRAEPRVDETWNRPPPPPAAAHLDEPAWAQGPSPSTAQPRVARGAKASARPRRGGLLQAVLALALAVAVAATWLYVSRQGLPVAPPLLAAPDAGAGLDAARAPEPPPAPPSPATYAPGSPAGAKEPGTKAADGSERPAATTAQGETQPAAAPPPAGTPPAGAAPQGAVAAGSPPPPDAPAALATGLVPEKPSPAPPPTDKPAPPPAERPPPAAEAKPPVAAAPPPASRPQPATAKPVRPPPAPAKKPEPAPARKAEPAPRGLKATLDQAQKLRARGKFEQALSLYSQAVADEPESAAALAGRGWCHLELSQYLPAEQSFRAALDADPRNADALFGMAETHRYMGKKSEAVTFYERFLAAHPDGEDAVAARNAISQLRE